MRYYAGNWPTSVWLFTNAAEETYDQRVVHPRADCPSASWLACTHRRLST